MISQVNVNKKSDLPAVPAAESNVGAEAEDDQWLDRGHQWISQRVVRKFGAVLPPIYSFVTVLAGRQTIGAVVTGWMPATAEDAVLFHVQHDDGACNSSVRLYVNGYEWFR